MKKEKFYRVLRLHRDDLKAEFEGSPKTLKYIENLSEAKLEALARKIGEDCCESGVFWNSIRNRIIDMEAEDVNKTKNR